MSYLIKPCQKESSIKIDRTPFSKITLQRSLQTFNYFWYTTILNKQEKNLEQGRNKDPIATLLCIYATLFFELFQYSSFLKEQNFT